jgi:hypothetical protein
VPILRPHFLAAPASRDAILRRAVAGSALVLLLALPLWQVATDAPAATHAAGNQQTATSRRPRAHTCRATGCLFPVDRLLLGR